MAEVINLRRVRRRLARADAAEDAAEARAKHGRTRTERETAAKDRDTLVRTLDGARLPPLARDGEDPE